MRNDILITAFCVLLQGCFSGSFRTYTAASTDDVGDNMATKYRYNINRMEGLFHNINAPTLDITAGTLDDYAKSNALVRVKTLLKTRYPHVFSESGIPVAIRITPNGMAYKNKWTLLLTILSITMFPQLECCSFDQSIDLVVAGDGATRDEVTLVSANDIACGIFPTALIPFGERPDCGSRRVYWQSDKVMGTDTSVHNSMQDFRLNNSCLAIDCFAYGVVAKLKEMEDNGKIDAMLQKLESAKSKAPPHRIVRFAREAGSDFTYEFALEFSEMPVDSSKVTETVLHEFGDSVKEQYVNSYPGAKKMSLAVSFHDVKVDGKAIRGRATVLSMSLVSLSYDTHTRRGKLSVQFNAGQAEEARKWIRKNIETLARDKNIALTTGQLPPAAKFYLGREELKDGNVLEIEFRTE